MLHESPLRTAHEKYAKAHSEQHVPDDVNRPGAATGQRLAVEVEYIPYGQEDDCAEPMCEMVADYGEVEAEYAAIRRTAAVLDAANRGTLLVTGKDRLEFFNRMVTQELKGLAPGKAAETFWLNRKGRIEADLLIVEFGDRIIVDVDLCQAAHTVKTLNEFLFTEEVEIKDVSDGFHHIAVHGKHASDVIQSVCGTTLDQRTGTETTIGSESVVIVRRDQTSETGYEIIVERDQANFVWEELLKSGGVRPIGWYAYNIARIESGTALMNIDFGATNLPHETGVLKERVSFKKGCYLGQEIVARMENLGKPKQKLVGLRIERDLLPVAGSQIFGRNTDGSMGEEVGVVTSSTLSPMLSATPIAFAMIKGAHTDAGNKVLVNAEGEQTEAIVTPLQFWPQGDSTQ